MISHKFSLGYVVYKKVQDLIGPKADTSSKAPTQQK